MTRPDADWATLLATLAASGPFDALLVAEVDREWVRVVRASAGQEALIGLTVSTRLTAWGALVDGEPTLCRGLAQRYPEDTLAQRLAAQSVAALALPDVAPARVVVLAVGAGRWQKPKPRLERLARLADVIAARLVAEGNIPLESLVRAFAQAGVDDDALHDGLRLVAELTEARWGLIVEGVEDDPGMGQPLYFLDDAAPHDRPSALPALPLAAVRARWTGTPPAAAAWLPGGGRAASASGRDLTRRDGRRLGAVALYHDDALAWTAARERALDLFAVLASGELAHRRLLQRGPTLPPPARAPAAAMPPGLPAPPEASGAILPPHLGPRSFELDVAVRSIAELLRPGLPDDVLLVVDAEGSLPPVKIDPARFQRVVSSLVAAAVDLPGARRVRVVAARRQLSPPEQAEVLAEARGAVDRALASDDPLVSVLVLVEGAGLAEETAAQALAEESAAALVTEIRGMLLARRRPGASQAVELVFPPARGVAAGTGSTSTSMTAVRAPVQGTGATMQVFRPPMESSARRRPLVLVVDDEAGVRRTLTRLLASSGARCIVAADGLEALETVRTRAEELDLVFLDVRMPSMGGFAALRAIKAAAPGLPVVLMSGYEPSEDERGEAAQVSQGFLTKPFRLDDVRRLVNELAPDRERAGSASG